MSTITKTMSFKYGIDIANTIIIDSARNLTNINNLIVNSQNVMAILANSSPNTAALTTFIVATRIFGGYPNANFTGTFNLDGGIPSTNYGGQQTLDASENRTSYP